jgi:uncharacterized membrane protein YoaK (UPF0700 family)
MTFGCRDVRGTRVWVPHPFAAFAKGWERTLSGYELPPVGVQRRARVVYPYSIVQRAPPITPGSSNRGTRCQTSPALATRSRPRKATRAFARVLISGYVDSYALLNFGVYASFMTGNTTSGGLHAGQGDLAAAGHSLLPIPFFLLGIFTGTLLVHVDTLRALRRTSILVAALLALGVARAYWAWPGWLGIMVLSIAMGILNTSVTHVGGQPVSLGFMTGDLNNLARHVAHGILRAPVPQAQSANDTDWRRATLLGSLWTFFLAGAILGGALASRVAVWTLLLPAALLLLLTFVESPTDSAA